MLLWLRAYAAAGGHLVLGPRTAYGDDEGRARTDVKPAHLAEAAAVRYQEFSNLNEPVPVTTETDGFDLSGAAQAMDWIDGLISDGAKVIATYDDRHFGQFPAIVSTDYGRGRITTVGTLPNPPLAADLLRWLAPAPRENWGNLPESVTVNSATNSDGRRIHVVHNWSWTPTRVPLPEQMSDLLADGSSAHRRRARSLGCPGADGLTSRGRSGRAGRVPCPGNTRVVEESAQRGFGHQEAS